ncbi:MAG: bifunctional riboflavin kinase/FAD synthetase [Gammaproteobacteria bacterium]
MRFFHNLQTVAKLNLPVVATIGNYDGVHLGHRSVLSSLFATAHELNLPTLVILFEPQPEEYFPHKEAPARLTTLSEKLLALQEIGVDYVLCLRFDEFLANYSAEKFIEKVLHKSLNIKYLVVGDDFVFGKNKQGSALTLEKYAKNMGWEVLEMPTYKMLGARVSSSAIRLALQNDDLELATSMLGHCYSMRGRVIHGEKRGREIGFPTANIHVRHKILPVSGVYVVRVVGIPDGKQYYGVVNIGFRPTFAENTRRLVEVYILDFEGDLYGHKLTIEFLHKLRKEQKFADFTLLQKQISKDISQTKKIVSRLEKHNEKHI